jgi:hypothetical protein
MRGCQTSLSNLSYPASKMRYPNYLSKVGAQIKQVIVRNSKFTSFIEEFTDNTYIMIVYSDQRIRKGLIQDMLPSS